MITYEKLKSKNLIYLKPMIEKSDKFFKKDFLGTYDKSNFIQKIFLRNSVYMFKYNSIYVGYMWIEKTYTSEYKILNIEIDFKYLHLLDLNIISKLKNSFLLYECLDTYENNIIMQNNKFNLIKNINLMKKKIGTTDILFNVSKSISFKEFKIGVDEKLRCLIQNDIFYNIDRVPLKVSDIYLEEKQDYYINKFSKFIYYKDEPIGYGQIIRKNSTFLLVNFGIISKFRGKGFGKILLEYLCYECNKENIEELYIQVGTDNFRAIRLYNKCKFKLYGKMNIWVRD